MNSTPESTMNMGAPPSWQKPTAFKQQFRWTFSSPNLKPDFNKSITINSATKTIILDGYSVMINGKDIFFTWVREMEAHKYCEDTYRLLHLDGCGKEIGWMEFDGLSLVGWEQVYDYASSEVVTTRVTLHYTSYRSPERDKRDTEIEVAGTTFVVSEATPLSFKANESKLAITGKDMYVLNGGTWEPLVVNLKEDRNDELLALLDKHKEAMLHCKGNHYHLKGVNPCLRQNLVYLHFDEAKYIMNY